MIVAPSVSSRFSREPGAAAASSVTVSAIAWPAGSPPVRRFSTSAQMNAASQRAARRSSASAGSVAASPAALSGQPRTAPLWLNSQGPAAKGAAAASPSAPASVASRTAASSASLRTTLARSAKFRSPQTGAARR